ncbi:MAG: hypothetical protein RL720_752 [Actinomycetota bacterium]|jgi:hypothetical protein
MTEVATLTWGIKESLIAYIERLEDGVIETSGGASRDGDEFRFTFDSSASDYNSEKHSGSLQFRGSVLLTGHWGGMRIEVLDPLVVIVGSTGELLTTSQSVFGPDQVDVFATLIPSFETSLLTATTQLAAAGRALMGQQYEVGQDLSPLSISL